MYPSAIVCISQKRAVVVATIAWTLGFINRIETELGLFSFLSGVSVQTDKDYSQIGRVEVTLD
jgi:hypothetical protein